MKVTPNQRRIIRDKVIAKMVWEGSITEREALLYNIMRSYAFDLKDEKRSPCKVGVRQLAEYLGTHINRIRPKIKSLERAGLIEPTYFVNIMGKKEGFKDFEWVKKKFNPKSIRFIEYEINDLPGEEKELKKFMKKKKFSTT